MTSTVPQRQPIRAALAAFIGTTIEFYDFYTYATAAALVLGGVFFPSTDPFVSTLASFATFAVGFIARPLSGAVFGHWGDRLGRKKMLILTMFLMGVATTGIGLLPSYASIGVAAPVILILVVPGIAAVVLAPDLAKPDQAYPTMMRLLPPGLLGLVFAALVAAIVASMASKINSIATIFTLDLYAKMKHVKTRAEDGTDPDGKRMEKHLVFVGRVVAVVSIVIALIVARPLLGKSDQAFQYIQEFTGFFTPGITVIFLLGLFWKRATEAGAIAAAVASVLLSFVYWLPAQYGGSASLNAVPFMHRMEIVFAASLVLAVVCSLVFPARGDANRVTMEGVTFKTPAVFNIGAVGVILILIALYATWW
jgi:Na+/proline symporter